MDEKSRGLAIATPLSAEVERLMYETIGCCIAVHRERGPGLLEKIYARALEVALTRAGIAFEREKRFDVHFQDVLVGRQSVDFLVDDCIVAEIKAVDRLVAVHHKQIINYMRIARVRAGLLVNFNVAILPDGLSRKVL